MIDHLSTTYLIFLYTDIQLYSFFLHLQPEKKIMEIRNQPEISTLKRSHVVRQDE
jgi:hypothetical protein